MFAQETKRVSELTLEDASSTFAATPPVESLKFMLSKCMIPADLKGLGFYDISRPHFHSPARPTIVSTPRTRTFSPWLLSITDLVVTKLERRVQA